MITLIYERMLSGSDPDIPQLKEVYQMPPIARYLCIDNAYFRYVTSTEHVFFYKVYENNTLVGSLHLEKQGTTLFLALCVFPGSQQRGLGTQIVTDIQNNVLEPEYDRIELAIDESNIASLKLFERAGFVRISKEDKLITFRYVKTHL